MKILITSGGTEEPLDGVRYITNFSTGRTGAGLAEYIAAKGTEVVLLHGYHAVLPGDAENGTIDTVRYRTFSDLDAQLQKILGNERDINAVIHLAAVSDYTPEFIETPDGTTLPVGGQGKISSGSETMIVRFRRNYKILSKIRGYARGRDIILTGFKLTNTVDPDEKSQAVQKILQEDLCDLLVHNDLNEIGTKPDDAHHAAYLYAADGTLLSQTQTKQQLFEQLYTHICQLDRRLHT
ncbi:MAG: DNA/pantothenate metabolism flavoprotein [Bacteroidetes bacterium]|nr:DNA/pantothenate metabolism flavoprotein [Bacteroidota bacterium]